MPIRRFVYTLSIAFALAASAAISSQAQSGAARQRPTPTPASEGQEDVRVFTEEVRIPVFATDEKGRFDPTLEVSDVLILEDDVPQQVKSVRHVPASILLLAGSSGELNPAIRTSTTRDIALNLLSNLRAGDSIAALQYSARTEVLQDWTTEKERVAHVLRSKLAFGRGSNLMQAIARAAQYMQTQPVGNRHLVLITDGVDASAQVSYRDVLRQLNAAQVTLHVISYTAVGQKMLAEQQKRSKEAVGMAQSRADMATVGIDPTRPPGMIRDGINPPPVNGGIRFDPELKRRRKEYERAMKRGEANLKGLVEETGGRLWLPVSTEEMIAQGGEVAREIGTQYVVTYRPKRPLSEAPANEYRRIKVGARRIGLQLRARRGYVVASMR